MDSRELEKLVEGISRIVDWYSSSNDKDGELLVSAKQKLLGYSFRFSVLVGEALDVFNSKYAERKSTTAQRIIKYINEGDKQFQASMKAEIDCVNIRLEEGRYEALYRRLKGQQEVINNTISSIMQDIKRLETEYKQTGN
jgi:hypothetical protein